MTTMLEKKIVFELEDIKSIRAVCPNAECQSEISRPPENAYKFPAACPHCRIEWAKPDEHDLLGAISKVLARQPNGRVRLKFEIEVGGDWA